MAQPKRGERLPDGFYRFEIHPRQLAAFWSELKRASEEIADLVESLDARSFSLDRTSYACGLYDGLFAGRGFSDSLTLVQELLPEGFREQLEAGWEKALGRVQEARGRL